MFAVIRTGGKQYLVSPGDKIKVEKLDVEEKKEIVFDEVLLVANDKKTVKIGDPLVKGAKVKAKVIKQDKAKKIIVFKYKPKKRYQKKKGHRQPYTEVEILKIENK
ncbi:MAG: 50S ribosomal protein L21 [Candidatus Portnoybacteria bacterium]|nr:50S ribosomal protein L21 [Candidatus Portnoybacteria bacterium]